MINITKESFEAEIEKCDRLAVIDLYADWCGPCKLLAPIMEELEREYPDVKFCKINVDEEPELAGEYGVFSIPTLVVLKNGKVSRKMTGARPKEKILDLFN